MRRASPRRGRGTGPASGRRPARPTRRLDRALRGPAGARAQGRPGGRLRAFGAFEAVDQLANGATPVKLLVVEDPETARHPAAPDAPMDALREAATHTQVVVTTHGAGLLDEIEPATDRPLVVQSRDGVAEIGPIDRAGLEAVETYRDSPGEWHRMDQLGPDAPGRRVAPVVAGHTVMGRGPILPHRNGLERQGGESIEVVTPIRLSPGREPQEGRPAERRPVRPEGTVVAVDVHRSDRGLVWC